MTMNRDAAREKFIDLVYDELSPAEREAVESHLNECDTCRVELSKLRLGRAAMAKHLSDEPEMAKALDAGIGKVIAEGKVRTYDMGGDAKTLDVASAIADYCK